MIKILVRAREYRSKTNFPKIPLWGKLKFQITNQQITIRTKFSGLKIEDIPKQNMQQCAAKFAAPDFPI
jgi:hypothetical protein